jgi:hypothetical protein
MRATPPRFPPPTAAVACSATGQGRLRSSTAWWRAPFMSIWAEMRCQSTDMVELGHRPPDTAQTPTPEALAASRCRNCCRGLSGGAPCGTSTPPPPPPPPSSCSGEGTSGTCSGLVSAEVAESPPWPRCTSPALTPAAAAAAATADCPDLAGRDSNAGGSGCCVLGGVTAPSGCLIEAPWLVNGVHGASLRQPFGLLLSWAGEAVDTAGLGVAAGGGCPEPVGAGAEVCLGGACGPVAGLDRDDRLSSSVSTAAAPSVVLLPRGVSTPSFCLTRTGSM